MVQIFGFSSHFTMRQNEWTFELDDLCSLLHFSPRFCLFSCVLLHIITLKVHRVRERSTHSQGITNHRGKYCRVLCFLGDRLCVISVCVTYSDNLCTSVRILLCVFSPFSLSIHLSFFCSLSLWTRVHGAARLFRTLSLFFSLSFSVFAFCLYFQHESTACTETIRTISFRFMDIFGFHRWKSSTSTSA